MNLNRQTAKVGGWTVGFSNTEIVESYEGNDTLT